MRPALVVFLLVLLCSCSHTRNRVVATSPDGSIVQQIDCRQDHPEKCHERAQQLCRPFGQEPTIIRPLAYDQNAERWTLLSSCRPR
jgi:hypothetical protein